MEYYKSYVQPTSYMLTTMPCTTKSSIFLNNGDNFKVGETVFTLIAKGLQFKICLIGFLAGKRGLLFL